MGTQASRAAMGLAASGRGNQHLPAAWRDSRRGLRRSTRSRGLMMMPAALCPPCARRGREGRVARSGARGMGRRIFFDGLNLALERGTGIATYTRMLTALVARGRATRSGSSTASPRRPLRDRRLRDSTFSGRGGRGGSYRRPAGAGTMSSTSCAARSARVRPPSRRPIARPWRATACRRTITFTSRATCSAGRRGISPGPAASSSSISPFGPTSCTAPIRCRCGPRGARNVYTIHDLIPLRLPDTTLDNKRADATACCGGSRRGRPHRHRVGAFAPRHRASCSASDEERVTNTYEAVEFPREEVERPRRRDRRASSRASIGSEVENYLLFFGAIEPKKNVKALIEAYLRSAVGRAAGHRRRRRDGATRPRSGCWSEIAGAGRCLADGAAAGAAARLCQPLGPGQPDPGRPRGAVPVAVRGVRAAGAGGDDVGDAGSDVARPRRCRRSAARRSLYVDPTDIADIARAIRTISADADLRAELSKRGLAQAELFSVARYRERVAALYDRLA